MKLLQLIQIVATQLCQWFQSQDLNINEDIDFIQHQNPYILLLEIIQDPKNFFAINFYQFCILTQSQNMTDFFSKMQLSKLSKYNNRSQEISRCSVGKKNYHNLITKLTCLFYKMSQPHTTETFTIQRIRQIAQAQQPDQDKYLVNLQLHRMNRQTLNELKTNVDFLDLNDEKENKLKNLLYSTFPTENERLLLEQKRQQDERQQNQKNKSDYVSKVLILITIYIAAFFTTSKTFFKTQYTQTGEKITFSTNKILLGIGCQLVIAIIALLSYYFVVKPKQKTDGDLNRKLKAN